MKILTTVILKTLTEVLISKLIPAFRFHNHKIVSKAAYDPENSPKAGNDIYEYIRERKK